MCQDDCSHDRWECRRVRERAAQKAYRPKPEIPSIQRLFTKHWSRHNRFSVLSARRRSIKLTYCIWWNSWVLTSASCFSCNFLSVSPPKDLSTALSPVGTECCWSLKKKKKLCRCSVDICAYSRILSFCLFIPNPRKWIVKPSKAISSTASLTTEKSKPHPQTI